MSEENSNRQRNGRWIKGGASPNPTGRPAIVGEIIELAREHSPAAIAALRAIVDDVSQPAQARVSGAIAILNRAYGAPPSALDVSILVPPEEFENPADDLTLEEVRAMQAILQAREQRRLAAGVDAESVADREAIQEQTDAANRLASPPE